MNYIRSAPETPHILMHAEHPPLRILQHATPPSHSLGTSNIIHRSNIPYSVLPHTSLLGIRPNTRHMHAEGKIPDTRPVLDLIIRPIISKFSGHVTHRSYRGTLLFLLLFIFLLDTLILSIYLTWEERNGFMDAKRNGVCAFSLYPFTFLGSYLLPGGVDLILLLYMAEGICKLEKPTASYKKSMGSNLLAVRQGGIYSLFESSLEK